MTQDENWLSRYNEESQLKGWLSLVLNMHCRGNAI